MGQTHKAGNATAVAEKPAVAQPTVTAEGLLKSMGGHYAGYVKAFGPTGQAAWLAYVKGRHSPNAQALKAAFEAVYSDEAKKQWKAYEADRAAFFALTGTRPPKNRFPKNS